MSKPTSAQWEKGILFLAIVQEASLNGEGRVGQRQPGDDLRRGA